MSQRDSNAILSRWAMDSLKEYDRVSGGGVTNQALLPMLMASLRHLADQQGWSWSVAERESRRLYNSEKEDA